MATSIIQFRVDDELKNEAAAVYEKLGIDLSTAMRMFLKRSVMENGIPFPMTIQRNYDTAKAIQAFKTLNSQAQANGSSEMSLEDINAEIDAYRKERKTKKE